MNKPDLTAPRKPASTSHRVKPVFPKVRSEEQLSLPVPPTFTENIPANGRFAAAENGSSRLARARRPHRHHNPTSAGPLHHSRNIWMMLHKDTLGDAQT